MVLITCVIIGDAMVGKTSLLTRQKESKFLRDYIPTSLIDHEDFSICSKGSKTRIHVWDTIGGARPDSLRIFNCTDFDAVLLCYSVMCPDSYENISCKWHEQTTKIFPNVPVILVGTKQDLSIDQRELAKLRVANKCSKSYDDGKDLALKIGAFAYCECSALTGIGVKNVFDKTVQAALQKRNSDSNKCLTM